MVVRGFRPDNKSWRPFLNPVFPALSAIKLGKALHGHIVKRVIFITTTYLKLYLTCGEEKPNLITIVTTLPVCACLLNMDSRKSTLMLVCNDAHAVFTSINHKDVLWNAIITGFAENKFIIDAFKMLKGPIEPNYVTIANILPVCASIDKNVPYCFVESPGPVTFVSILPACAQLQNLQELQKRGMKPDAVTFMSLLLLWSVGMPQMV
ncbi:hypothetical protein CMV_024092 [Castanea mollissima]|uniref:Uncharacterized protein n=1 Tax=Castanea mollissima TaxID=60419 RepID=A0A8J4VA01_9ROSI|nr:hypothetical protein CMV_024092 [Castanea mollissima]